MRVIDGLGINGLGINVLLRAHYNPLEMHRAKLFFSVFGLALAIAACSNSERGGDAGRPATPSIPPPADVAAPPADATRTPTGLASKVLTPGTGTRHPRPNSRVTVHYTGWTTDGKMFDSSIGRDPVTFELTGVISGWTEGVQMMVVGEKRRFWIPEKLAYAGGGGPAGMLVFDIELLRIES